MEEIKKEDQAVEVEKKEAIQEVLEEMDEEDFLNNDLIQDNKICFSLNNNIYRVRMPNQKEISQAKEKRNSLYIQKIQKENTLTKKKLKKVLKEKQGVDIDKMQDEADEIEKKILDIYFSLAQCKDSEPKTINKFKEQIQELKKQRTDIVLEIAECLSSSIEVQVEDSYMEYLTFLCTEKLKTEKENKEEWISVWQDLEEFEKDLDRKLRLTATGWLTHLLVSVGG